MPVDLQSTRQIGRVRDNRINQSDVPSPVKAHGTKGRTTSGCVMSGEALAYVETRIAEINRRHRINERREAAGLPVFDLTPDEFDFESFSPVPAPCADKPDANAETDESLLAVGAGLQADDDPFEDD